MEVTILEGCQTAVDCNGKIYEIEGMQLTRQSGLKVAYGKETSFYKAATFKNIKSNAFLCDDGKIILT